MLLKRGRARKGRAQTLINAEVSVSEVSVHGSVPVYVHAHRSLGVVEILFQKVEHPSEEHKEKRSGGK